MKRAHLLAILLVGGLVVGATVARAAPVIDRASAGSASAEPAATTSSNLTISVTLQQLSGDFWTVQGFVFRVTSATTINGDVPTIGTFVSAQGTVQSDGTWLATSIQ